MFELLLERSDRQELRGRVSERGTGGVTDRVDLSDMNQFILSVLAGMSPPGGSRGGTFFSESCTVVYNVIGNRYCGRVQREHRSNQVMLAVDLRRGVYYQKCYDPDCCGYRSEVHALPPGAVAGIPACYMGG